MMYRYSCHLALGALGLIMGFTLSRSGFTSWSEIHQMFVFEDLRLILTFACAVVVSLLGFQVFGRNLKLPTRRIYPGSIPGGILFGSGWALCGACPSIVWVQLGEGRLTALVSALGIMIGIYCYPWVHARLFHWHPEQCAQ